MTTPEPHAPQPVAIYTMGKVGSSSVTTALTGAGFEALQIHVLRGGLKTLKRRMERRPNAAHLKTSVQVVELIDSGQPPMTITLMREPVARNVSAFFQNFGRLVGGDVDSYTAKEIQSLICEKVSPREPQDWIEEELEEIAEVDFGRHHLYRGATTATEAKWPVLLLRSDLDDDSKSASMREFLDHPDITVERSSNITAEKSGGDLYSEIKRIGLPKSYVDECLSQPFVKNLLSAEEIEASKARWTEST